MKEKAIEYLFDKEYTLQECIAITVVLIMLGIFLPSIVGMFFSFSGGWMIFTCFKANKSAFKRATILPKEWRPE